MNGKYYLYIAFIIHFSGGEQKSSKPY